jgi:hypothetical protein
MNEKDVKELQDSLELIKNNPNDAILMTLTDGEFVLLGKGLFVNLAKSHNITPKEEDNQEIEDVEEKND